MSELEIRIDMTPETVITLIEGGFVLQAFRAVRCSNRSARGLLWRLHRQLSAINYLRWSQDLGAFTSFDQVELGRRVAPGFSVPMAPGQRLEIGTGGLGTVLDASGKSLIFNSTLDETITCGLSGTAGTDPFCAIPLLPGFAETVEPVSQVVLLFGSRPADPGTVVESPLELTGSSAQQRLGTSPGVLVDLAGVGQRQLSFDIGTGWQWGGGSWARPVSSTADLTPLLIQARRARSENSCLAERDDI